MQDLIVLGLVPGTSIQLDFSDWLLISATWLLLWLLVRERHELRSLIVSRYVAFRLAHLKISEAITQA